MSCFGELDSDGEEDVEDLEVMELLKPMFEHQARWIAFLEGGGSAQEAQGGEIQVADEQVMAVLNKTIGEIVKEHFDRERADQAETRKSVMEDFLKNKVLRQVVYDLAEKDEGESTWIQNALQIIAEAKDKDGQWQHAQELLAHAATSECYVVFVEKFEKLLLSYLEAVQDRANVQSAVDSFCGHTTVSKHTYLYAQAMLAECRGKCPAQAPALLFLSQALTTSGLASAKLHSVVQTLDLSLSSVSEQTELCDLLRALFRRGKEEKKMLPKDVAIVCPILDRLFGFQSEGKAASCAPTTLPDETTPSTEVASDAGNWGKTPRQVPEDSQPNETGSVSSWGLSAAAKEEEEEEEDMEDKAGKEALDIYDRQLDETKGKKGIQHFLRSLYLSDQLMLQFVDPDTALTEKQQGDHAKLLAMIWHDGLASEDPARQQAAREEVNETAVELGLVHKVTHTPCEWLQQLKRLINLNKTKLGCAAGLCWLKHCALGRMSGRERLLRMSQPSVPFMLLEAWKAHNSLLPGVLDVVHHMLEHLESQEDDDERLPGSAPGRAALQGDPRDPKACRDTFFKHLLELLVFWARQPSSTAVVLDLVTTTAAAKRWPTEELRRFLLPLLQNSPAATKETNFAVLRLLVSASGLEACKGCADPFRPSLCHFLKQLTLTSRQDSRAEEELRAAMEKLRPLLAKDASPEPAESKKRACLHLSDDAREHTSKAQKKQKKEGSSSGR